MVVISANANNNESINGHDSADEPFIISISKQSDTRKFLN